METDQLMDGRTNQPTDKVSYRGTIKKNHSKECTFVYFFSYIRVLVYSEFTKIQM
jgi:hypothetical protein